jgi:ornithine cyclodeaminase/alanine dehydrogenase-like protein (mu-crystallin family)
VAPHLDASTIEPLASWPGVMQALVTGHDLPEAQLDDTLLRRGPDALLSRSALIDGLGSLVKTATVFPGNASRGRPTVNGSVSLFSDDTGELDATLDFHVLTKWKTAADSVLAASRLAPPEVGEILIVGSGSVAASMIEAYRSVWPDARLTVWSRSPGTAADLADRAGATATDDLERAVRRSDVISTTTMATEPLIFGTWLHPGQHLDLIGGYRPDMREADDECLARSRVFVDSRRTAADVGDIGEPQASGALTCVEADFGDLATGRFRRIDPDEITVFKNAGGAHLDLMVARHLTDLTAG